MRFVLVALFLIGLIGGGLFLVNGGLGDSTIDDRTEPVADAGPPDAVPAGDGDISSLLDTVSGDSQQTSAELEARMTAEAVDYTARLEATLIAIRAADTPSRSSSLEEINTHLDQLAEWAGLADVGSNRRLTGEQEVVRARYRSAVVSAQRAALPRLRTAYAATIAGQAGDVNCTAGGTRSLYLSCEASAFERDAQLRSYHSRNRAIVWRLRFRQARYRSDTMRSGQFYSYDLDVPGDSDVVIWTDVLEFRTARD
jgi:hypothetical protein